MHTLYFRNLPLNVARSAFRDAVEKFVVNMYGEGVDAPKPIIDMVILDRPTSEKKHVGFGAIQFADEKTMEMFIARLKTEPMMFGQEAVAFSREQPPNLQASSSGQSANATPASTSGPQPTSSKDRRSQSSKSTSTQASKKRDNAQPSAPNRPVMNLNRVKHPQFEKREVRLPNIKYLRKLHHRLSIIGQHLRLETLEFGVLRNWNFSVEYSRPLVDETGYFIFEDDEKSLRISIGGSHQDSTQPSVAIAIQTINYVALGTDAGKKYMFLALAQNPHFELGDISRPTTGVGKFDVRRSRNRLSALDERHERVAPYTSRWIKLTFHEDSIAPTAEMCQMAGLGEPAMDPPLSFGKLDMYSAHNIAVVEKWFQGGSLDFEVAFQIEALFRNAGKEVQGPGRDALRTFRAEIQGAGARKSFNDFEDKNVVEEFEVHVRKSAESMPWEKIGISKASFMCYHVKITPTAVHLNGPLEEQSNRVIRRYPGYETHFIRVAFTDEADGRARFEYEVDTMAFTQKRVGKFLKNAIRLCDREYELLGYSQSGFRENACFFVAPFEWKDEIINGEYIRYSLGNFDKVIDCPARYGARMSQAFSSTSQSTMLQESEIRHIMELKNRRDEMFSDGCGTISRELAKDVWKSMLQHLPPSRQGFHHENELPPPAFQIRIGGSKGMVRLDPKLEGRVLCLRPSMTKFEAEHDLSLEIARAPLVVLLWSGGVEDDVFLNLMKDNLAETMSGMTTLGGAAKLLIANRLGVPFQIASTLNRLSRLKIELGQDGVRTSGLHKLLNATLFHIKRDLKHKSRIKVPDSYTLVGVCDEDDYLRPRQIYACVQHFDQRSGKAEVRYLKGRYLVTRSPVIHPGDAQVVWAIGEPPVDSPFYGEGNNLPNIVVFSSKGPRPIPNMLGGGDLDGVRIFDLYNLISVQELIPRYRYCPANYPTPRSKKIGRNSTIEDVADFMVEYICHDSLGMIATNHLVIASTSDMRARDENCIVNAELHSRAVDFVKTGFYVANHQIRKAKYDKAFDETTGLGLKPDWQAGHGRDANDGRYYPCDSVLGKLFRAVELPEGNPARESDVEDQVPTTIRNRVAGFVARYKDEIQATVSSSDTVTFIQSLLSRYTSELNHICVAHTISSESAERVSEVEVMLGTNLEVSSKPDLIERMKSLTRNLTNTIRYQLKAKEDESNYIWLGRAWRAYLLTSSLGDKTFGAFSFSWLALDSVLDALQTIDENFLPHTGPILPPFAFIPSKRPETDESLHPPNYDTWDDWVDAIKEGDTEIETANTAEEYGNQQNGNARGVDGVGGEEVGTTTGRTRMEAITDTTATVAAMARAKGPTAMDKPMARSGVVGPATELLLPVTFPSEMGYNDENKHVLYSSPPLCFGCCVSNETAPNRV
ncbi:RNA-dependent RNA polymerase [Rhizoctonia solani]|uniref:RNA-dependent RNA polymerase n=1 Tax=Rhizoctonia solani TaxID=456999 RepID=A0A8H8NRK0_9AGAM|nr:RNA-dependent RNA polymerase [Rhizoctonia solani]QRW18035.1 RNA-dependent RNA polymerase [Rhizoctonia solani]